MLIVMKASLAAALLVLALAGTSAWARRGDDSQCANTPKAEEAIAACTRLYENEGLGSRNRAIALGNRGAALKLLGRYDEALADFAVAIELAPSNPQYYCQRGDILVRKKQFEEAIADYSAALKKSRGFVWALAGRGQAYLSQGNAQAAVDDFTQALRSQPGEMRLLLLRGRANSQAEAYEAAVADLTQVLASKAYASLLPKERAVILSQRAFAQLKQDRSADAKSDVEEALKIAPKSAFAIAMMGLVDEQFGRKPEAKDSYTRALAIEPQLEFARLGLERLNQTGVAATNDKAGTTTTQDKPGTPATPNKTGPAATPDKTGTEAALSTPASPPKPPPAAAPARPPAEDLCAKYVPQVGTTVLVACEH